MERSSNAPRYRLKRIKTCVYGADTHVSHSAEYTLQSIGDPVNYTHLSHLNHKTEFTICIYRVYGYL
jgi:hypothetical protein